MNVMTSLHELQARIGSINKKNGFHHQADLPEDLRKYYWGNKLLLVVSEVIEAQDELRSGRGIAERYYSKSPESPLELSTPKNEDDEIRVLSKPEGAPSEIADAVIRLLDIAEESGWDMEEVILEKLRYNETRSFRHGGKQF